MARRLNDTSAQLLRVLADGECHSGETLGAALGMSRAGVWKQLKRLETLGLETEAVRGTGYRLRQPLDLYDEASLRDAYCAAAGEPGALEIIATTGSTNSDLMAVAGEASREPRILFAEHQAAGRGRRGRGWVTPYGAAIAFSLLRRFDCAPAELGALSLVAGVALLEPLNARGARGLGLKWPNDLVHRDAEGKLRKLGGVLVEVVSEAQGPCAAVIGVGINYAMPEDSSAIDQPWIDLLRLLDLQAGDRSRLAGQLAGRLARACDEFEQDAGEALLRLWPRYDVLQGEGVEIRRGTETVAAVATGIDAGGALRVDIDGEKLTVHSGEVSIRKRDYDPRAGHR